jgi:hypothetical protein
MTDPTTLLALAERCEQAAGPDRVLDAEITKSFIPRDATHIARSRYGWSFIISGSGQEFEWLENQPYTDSLDTAITLVPEGWRYDLTNGDLVSEEKPAARLTPDFAGPCFNGYARTVPLALCVAALRARAAMAEHS